MPKRYLLDKIYTGNTDYTMSADKALIIKALGYDTSEDLTPKIDGADLGVINKEVCPASRVYDFDLPLLDLGPLFYVAPPDKVMRFNATIGGNVRVVGEMLDLGPGETLPPSALSRLTVQGSHFRTFKSGSVKTGTWTDKTWLRLLELVPKTKEQYLFNSYVGFNMVGETTPNLRALTKYQIRFIMDGKPLDNLLTAMGHLGIDCMSMFHPPTYNKQVDRFSLKDFPITVPGDVPFVIEAYNGTDADISLTTSLYPIIYLVCEYQRLG